MPRGNPVGEFNTRGQDKCPHCGDYYPSAWVIGHVGGCAKNPANQIEDETEEDDA